MVQGSKPIGRKIFCTFPDGPWGPPILHSAPNIGLTDYSPSACTQQNLKQVRLVTALYSYGFFELCFLNITLDDMFVSSFSMFPEPHIACILICVFLKFHTAYIMMYVFLEHYTAELLIYVFLEPHTAYMLIYIYVF